MNDAQLILNAIESMGNRFDSLEGRFDFFENRFDSLENRFDSLESRFDLLESHFDSLEGEVRTIKDDIKMLQDEGKATKDEVKSINLTLENEIARNISVIAEGHVILERKLDESLKVSKEKEMLLIRVNHLENEVRKLKEQINGIA